MESRKVDVPVTVNKLHFGHYDRFIVTYTVQVTTDVHYVEGERDIRRDDPKAAAKMREDAIEHAKQKVFDRIVADALKVLDTRANEHGMIVVGSAPRKLVIFPSEKDLEEVTKRERTSTRKPPYNTRTSKVIGKHEEAASVEHRDERGRSTVQSDKST